jgi:hypothetical protein
MSDPLDQARAVLRRSEVQAPSLGAEARVRARLRGTLDRRWYEPTWRQVVPALVAMAAAWVGVAVRPGQAPPAAIPAQEFAERPLPTPPRGALSSPSKDTFTGLHFGSSARYVLPEVGAARPVLRLEWGNVEVGLEPGETLGIETAHASISALASRFQVEVTAEETRIQVAEGTVHVQGPDAPEQVLGAGQRLSVRARQRPSAPAAKVAAPALEGEQRHTLAVAKQALAEDPPRAAALAEQVLGQAPGPEIEVQALALLADAERRQGAHRRAFQVYGRVARHPGGRGYAEEALYRQAALATELGQEQEALGPLKEAENLFPRGPLAPERAALLSRLELKNGHPERAAAALLRVPVEGRPALLAEARLEVAQALWSQDPEQARSLLQPILSDNGVPVELLRRAQVMLGQDEPGAPAQLR